MTGPADLAFFCLLAKKGNLSAAAREMGITPPAVSKRLSRLERRLGVRLLNRTTRKVSLTNEGEVYLQSAARILSEIDELEHRVSSSRAVPKGLLRINATFGFGRSYVAPAVSAFAKRYREVEVRLQLTDRPLNLSDEGYDLSIWFGELPQTRMIARKIASNSRTLFAAPAYLEKHGRPKVPSDLARHECIVLRQDVMAQSQWRFTSGRRTETVKVRGRLSTNDGDAALKWALDGHGILMRSVSSVWGLTKYVRSGRLVVILEDYALPKADIFAIYPQRHHLSAKVTAFIEFLIARFKDPRIFELPAD